MVEEDESNFTEDADGDVEAEPSTGYRLGRMLAWPIVLGAIALVGVVLYRIYPGSVRDQADPSFLDNIFDNNLVIFAARLVLFSAALVLAFLAVYTIVSIVKWMEAKQWLSRAGPFEVSSHAIDALEEQVRFWYDQATRLGEQVQELSQRLEASNELLEELYAGSPDAEEDFEADAGSGTVEQTDDEEEPGGGR